MKNIVFVNATAATEGGVLTILNQFICELELKNDNDKVYYIFVSTRIDVDHKNIKIIDNIKGKSKIDRIKWDMIGMRRWAIENNIAPNCIISLQNTGVRFNNIPQIVYVHQSLPYAKESKWNILKSDERKLWFYKYIYKIWIDLTVKNKVDVVVQTEWMRQELLDRGYTKKNIIVANPNSEHIDISNIIDIKKDYKYLFYPASDYKYKNHIILIKAVKKIVEKGLIDEKFKIIFTLNKESNVYKDVIKFNMEKYFEFIGMLKYNEVLSYYKKCQSLVFPSYIETFGLPLIEASKFGKRILVCDCNYSREVIGDYPLARFIKYDDIDNWVDAICWAMNEYELCPESNRCDDGWKIMFDYINEKIQN